MRSVNNKIRQVYDFASSQYKLFDFFALTETWLGDSVTNDELFPNSYNVFRSDRSRSAVGLSRGGGVLLAVNSAVAVCEMDLETVCPLLSSIPLVDILGISVRQNTHTIHVFVIYIPPRITASQLSVFFDALEAMLVVCKGRSVIIGDFNISKYAESLTSSAGDRSVRRLNNLCDLFDLKQYNYVVNDNGRLLDLLISSEVCSVERAEDVITAEDAHHPALYIKFAKASGLQKPASYNPTSFSYNFRRADFPSLYKYISGVSWDSVVGQRDANAALESTYTIIFSAFDRFVPRTGSIKRTTYPPWFTSSVKRKIRSKALFWRQYKHLGDSYAYQRFKTLRSEIKNDIKTSFAAFMRHTESQIKTDPKRFWSYLNNKSAKNPFPTNVSWNSVDVDGIQEVVDVFACCFSSAFTVYDGGGTDPGTTAGGDLRIDHIEDSEILRGFKKLKPNLSAGPDGVPGLFVVDCRFALLKPLRHIFHLILNTSCFPDRWKVSRVVPVFKKGDRRNVSNYRPVAILDNFCKILEFCLYNPMMNRIKPQLSGCQHGFVPGRSTTTNLFVVTQFISDHLDNSSQVDVVYTDFSKAFDRLDHKLLLCKFRRFGFSEALISLFRSYFMDRLQYVANKGIKSHTYTIPSGVPQGSILGPLFFNMFIDDITCNLSVQHLLYADDLKLFYPIVTRDDCSHLQRDLDGISNWCIRNHLPLNISKCSALSFFRIKTPFIFPYVIDGNVLSRPVTFDDLGVTFDSQLSFVPHINTVISRSYKCMGSIMRNGKHFSSDTLLNLFNAFVRSRLEYASIIWSPTYANHIGDIESVLRKFLKFLSYRADGEYPVIGYPQELLLQRFGIPSLERRRQYHSVVFLYKIVNSIMDCDSISRRLVFNTPRSGARYPIAFYLPLAHTRAQQSSPLYCMCRNYCLVQHCVDIIDTCCTQLKSAFFGTG